MAQDTKTSLSVWTKVFRAIVARIEQDPDVRRVIGAQNVRSWKGVPGDGSPMAPATGAPILRLTPQFGSVSWYSEDAQYGDLRVKVEIAVATLNIDNVTDIYDLLISALSPTDNAFCQSLVNLGAETGQVTFTDIATDPQPQADPQGYFNGLGGFSLSVIRQVNV